MPGGPCGGRGLCGFAEHTREAAHLPAAAWTVDPAEKGSPVAKARVVTFLMPSAKQERVEGDASRCGMGTAGASRASVLNAPEPCPETWIKR